MKTVLCALVSSLWSMAALALPADAPVDTIQTLHGRTYYQCRILQRAADGILFSHTKGKARVLYEDLPNDQRLVLGYNPQAAADLEKARLQARKDKEQAERERLKKAAEAREVERLAMLKMLSQWPQAIYVYPQQGIAFSGPIPAVGFAAPGWGGYTHHHGHGGHTASGRGWDAVGLGSIRPGTDGIYQQQGGGFQFYGLPQVLYSPTLGYYNPGAFGPVPQNQVGTFNVVPGLGPAPVAPPPAIPSVGIRGGMTLGGHR